MVEKDVGEASNQSISQSQNKQVFSRESMYYFQYCAMVVIGAVLLSSFNPPFLAYGPNFAKAETTDEKGCHHIMF